MLLVLVACSDAPSPPEPPIPISFRVLSRSANDRPCHDAPDFVLANDEARWVDAFDLQTACLDDRAEIELPVVDFTREVAVAAWWARVGCAAYVITVTAVERLGDEVWLRARSTAPAGPCAGAVAQLETFLAVERPGGERRWRFELDGRVVGSAPG